MDSLDREVLRRAAAWRRDGGRVWLVTVVETWGSAPRIPGALLALAEDGRVIGSVSGGCVEDDLVDRVRHGQHPDHPALVTYGVTKDDAARFGLPCGGSLRLLQEPLTDPAWIDELLARTAGHEIVARTLDLETGHSRLERAARGEGFTFDGRRLRAVFGPRWRLLIVGAGQLSRAVAQMALGLDFEVTCCDPREEHAGGWDLPGTRFSREMPDDLVLEMRLDAHSAVVALTHDPKLDDLVLLEALRSPAFYVGALGSRVNTARRLERLRLFDLSDPQLARLHGPIGLDIGARLPAEIAVSVVAELVAVRNGVALRQKKAGAFMPAPAVHISGGMPLGAASSVAFGASATMQSVVSSSPAIEAAF
jgi:xanthine dehydrogenase accessory factor